MNRFQDPTIINPDRVRMQRYPEDPAVFIYQIQVEVEVPDISGIFRLNPLMSRDATRWQPAPNMIHLARKIALYDIMGISLIRTDGQGNPVMPSDVNLGDQAIEAHVRAFADEFGDKMEGVISPHNQRQPSPYEPVGPPITTTPDDDPPF